MYICKVILCYVAGQCGFKVYGEEYHRNDFVHLGWQLNDLPPFTKVKDILVIGGLTFFQVESTKLLG